MQVALDGAATWPEGLCVTTQAEGLDILRDADCAGVIWHRPGMEALQVGLAALAPDSLPRARVVLRPAVVARAMESYCAQVGMPAGATRTALISDVAMLADRFAEVMGCAFLRLRLDAVTGNACRKFHQDALTARLVCTYRGPGTQYGSARAGGDPDLIGTVPTCAPILLRGRDWPPARGATLLHRSPPIEGTGETRLVLVLDPVEQSDI